jgi:dTDP-4-dehydrorhamnose reductase
MKNVLVIGETGLVGSRFVELTKDRFNFIFPDEKELDITLIDSVNTFFKAHPEIEEVVNFAAFTNVDAAEKERGDERGLVWRVNVEGAKNIAQACSGKLLIQISTDFIFPGTSENPGPYVEDAQTPESMDGISWYGWTKLQGEKVCQAANSQTAVVRIAYPFRATLYDLKTDFARNFLTLFDEEKLYPLFTDQQLTPVFIDELSEALAKILELAKPGIYHVVTADTTTPFEFAGYLLEKARGVKDVVKPGSLVEFMKAPGRTPRPTLGGLKTEKTQETLGMKFSTWREAVDKFVAQLK